MLSSIYTKAYFISKYSLKSILIRNPCFYNKIKKGGSSEQKKKKLGAPAGKELLCRKRNKGLKLFLSIWEKKQV